MAKARNEEMDLDHSEEEVNGAMFENNDDGLSVDMSNVEAMKFDVLPAGDYNCIISDNQYQLSKSSGKPMWNLSLTVVDEQYQNRKLFTFMSFSEKALPGTKANMMHFAPELLEGPFNPKNPEIVSSLIGRHVKVRVSVEKYNNDDTNRIKRFKPRSEDDAFMG